MTHPPRDEHGATSSEEVRCWIRVSEAAERLGVSASTVRRRIAAGTLPGRREPYRGGFRWLVQLPPPEAQIAAIDEPGTSEATPTADPPAEPAAGTHADDAPVLPGPGDRSDVPEVERVARPEGTMSAFLIATAVLALVLLLQRLELPGWTSGVLFSVAAVSALIAAVELFLLLSERGGRRHGR